MTKRQFEFLQLFNCIPLIGIVPWFGVVLLGLIMGSNQMLPGNILSWLLVVSITIYPAMVIHGVLLGYDGLGKLSKSLLLRGLALSYSAPVIIVFYTLLLGHFY